LNESSFEIRAASLGEQQ